MSNEKQNAIASIRATAHETYPGHHPHEHAISLMEVADGELAEEAEGAEYGSLRMAALLGIRAELAGLAARLSDLPEDWTEC